MLWALVPVKELSKSKQRLAGVLDKCEREGLVLAMLRDVLTVIHGISAFDGILVVSRSSEARALAREFGMDTFVESPGSDHSMAVTEANRYLNNRHCPRSTLALPSDVPLLTAEDVYEVVAHHDRVTLVPNEAGEGTNAVLASPPNVITYHFGEQSLRKHTDSAIAAGVTPAILRNKNIARDIDEPQDLVKVQADLPPSFTRDYLESIGIAPRMSANEISTIAQYG